MTTLVLIPSAVGPSTVTAYYRDIPTRLASALQAEGRSVVVASDSGDLPSNLTNASGVAGAKFDWNQSSTWDNAFSAAQPGAPIDRVFLTPDDNGLLPQVEAFINYAKNNGVVRFVVLGVTALLDDVGPEMGLVHDVVSKNAEIRARLSNAGVDYTVLQPSITLDHVAMNIARTIKEHGEIATATGNGRLNLITFDDVVDGARNALTTEKPTIGNQAVLGPKSHSFTEIAEVLSGVLGRTVTHKHVPAEESARRWAAVAAPDLQPSPHFDALTKALHTIDGLFASAEEKLADAHATAYYGNTRLEDWATANRHLFA